MILIFDKEGKFLCSTETLEAASKITGAAVANISKVLQGTYQTLTSNDHFFLKSPKNGKYSKATQIRIERALKIVNICEDVQGLPNRVNEIMKVLRKNEMENEIEGNVTVIEDAASGTNEEKIPSFDEFKEYCKSIDILSEESNIKNIYDFYVEHNTFSKFKNWKAAVKTLLL